MPSESERFLVIFVDFDNIAQGFRRNERFDIQRVLKRMVEKGKIVVKKTYADWSRYGQYTASLHEAAFELVEIPKRSLTGKNSADIRLCVDAMDLAYAKPHIDTFVIVSGDSDFTPLVSKLKEMGKHVIGMGMQGSTSELLRDNCDEFIYYEDLEVEKAEAPRVDLPVTDTKRKALELLMEACVALRRENKDKLWASLIKETMKRKKPSFNETYHGFRTFSAMLEDAQAQGLVELERDEQRGTYVVTRFGDEIKGPRSPAPHARGARSGQGRESSRESSRERGRGRGRPAEAPATFAEPAKPDPRKESSPRRDILEPKPRVSSFQGFQEFEQEAAAFLGPKFRSPLDEDFPGFGGPIRTALEPTSGEVMAKMNVEPRAAAPTPEPPEITPPEEVEAVEEDKGDKRRSRKRKPPKKECKEPKAVAGEPHQESVPAVEQTVGFEPISFDDVPFVAASAAPPGRTEPIPEAKPFFEPAESPAVREPVAPPMVREPAPKKTPPAEAPKDPPKAFGFGIFDE